MSNENNFLTFPYKSFFESDEYKNRKSDSPDLTDERREYYRKLYKEHFPDKFSHIRLGVRYFPLIPLRIMAAIEEYENMGHDVAPFFHAPSSDNAPRHSYVESLDYAFKFILGEMERFYQVYHSFAFHDDSPCPSQIGELEIDFAGYLLSLESLCDDDSLDALYEAQKRVAPLFNALATKTVGIGMEESFRENMSSLRTCTERIVRALYKRECLCYAAIGTRRPDSEKKKT